MDFRNLSRNTYNKTADQYGSTRNIEEDLKHLENLAYHLKPGSTVLDVGSGTGLPVAKFLSDKGYKVLGVDISEEMVTKARQNVPEAEFVVMDMTDLDFFDNSFDAVVAFHSIYHVPKEEHEKIIQKFYNLTVAGGYLMVTSGAEEHHGMVSLFGLDLLLSHHKKEKFSQIVTDVGWNIIYEEEYNSWKKEHLIILAQKPEST